MNEIQARTAASHATLAVGHLVPSTLLSAFSHTSRRRQDRQHPYESRGGSLGEDGERETCCLVLLLPRQMGNQKDNFKNIYYTENFLPAAGKVRKSLCNYSIFKRILTSPGEWEIVNREQPRPWSGLIIKAEIEP